MKTGLAVLLIVFATFAAFAQDKQLDIKIASIDGPCSQIVGRLCYNAYEDANGSSWFGVYSFDDPAKKVSLVEPFDCRYPNARMKWGSASKKNPNGTFPVFKSKKVKGLYESCYGTALKPVTVNQHSSGANSPNIAGANNVVIINK